MKVIFALVLQVLCFGGIPEEKKRSIRRQVNKVVENYLREEAPNAVEGFVQFIEDFLKSQRPAWHFTILERELNLDYRVDYLRYCMAPKPQALALKLLNIPNLYLLDEVEGLVEPPEKQRELAELLRVLSKMGLSLSELCPGRMVDSLIPFSRSGDSFREVYPFMRIQDLLRDEMTFIVNSRLDETVQESAHSLLVKLIDEISEMQSRFKSVSTVKKFPLEVVVDVILLQDCMLGLVSFPVQDFLDIDSFYSILVSSIAEAIDLLSGAGDGIDEERRVISGFEEISNRLLTGLVSQLETGFVNTVSSDDWKFVRIKHASMRRLVDSIDGENSARLWLLPEIISFMDRGFTLSHFYAELASWRFKQHPNDFFGPNYERFSHKLGYVGLIQSLVDVSVRVINNPNIFSSAALSYWINRKVRSSNGSSSSVALRILSPEEETLSFVHDMGKFYGTDLLNEYKNNMLLLPDWSVERKQAVGFLFSAAVRLSSVEEDTEAILRELVLAPEDKVVEVAKIPIAILDESFIGSKYAPLLTPWKGLMLRQPRIFASIKLSLDGSVPRLLLPPKLGEQRDVRRQIRMFMIAFPAHLVELSRLVGDFLETARGRTNPNNRFDRDLVAGMPQTALVIESETGNVKVAEWIAKYIALLQNEGMWAGGWEHPFLNLYGLVLGNLEKGRRIPESVLSRFDHLSSLLH